MDLLDRVHPVGRDLLDRVDATLSAHGAPADHPVWPLLRRLGAPPGAVVAHLAGVSPDGLTSTAEALRREAGGYQHRTDEVPMPAAWRGPASDAYGAAWGGLSAHLAGTGPDTLAGRLTDTATYLDEVCAWIRRSRRALAGTLAECLGSGEAVTLHAAPVTGELTAAWFAGGGQRSGHASPAAVARAAATVAAHVLTTAGEVLDDGRALHDRWAGRLGELSYRAPAPAPVSGAHLRLG
jgi:hypothetical protein